MAYIKDLSGRTLIPNVWDLRVEDVLRGEGFLENDILFVRKSWAESHRFYHNNDHLRNLVDMINGNDLSLSDMQKSILIIAAAYHDVVYDPKYRNGMNEAKSRDIFLEHARNTKYFKEQTVFIDVICAAIISIADREAPKYIPNVKNGTEDLGFLPQTFWMMDNAILNCGLKDLLDYENKIYKEYQQFSWSDYKKARIEFLEAEFNRTNNSNLLHLKSFIETRRPNVALYVGSFDPFHIGHLNILQKAEQLFDKVILVRGVNPEKSSAFVGEPDGFPVSIQNRQTLYWDGLTTDLVKNLEKDQNVTVIRGLRDGKDLDYETNLLRGMEDLYKDVRVIFVHCDKQYEHVSSSMIRKNRKFGERCVERYLVK
jgi:pantetheine-phosphate adenylyltransferase